MPAATTLTSYAGRYCCALRLTKSSLFHILQDTGAMTVVRSQELKLLRKLSENTLANVMRKATLSNSTIFVQMFQLGAAAYVCASINNQTSRTTLNIFSLVSSSKPELWPPSLLRCITWSCRQNLYSLCLVLKVGFRYTFYNDRELSDMQVKQRLTRLGTLLYL